MFDIRGNRRQSHRWPQLSEGQSHFAVSQFKVPDTRRARGFLRHRLSRLFRARRRAGRTEPAWEPGVDPTQRTAVVGERRHSVAGVCLACRCPVVRVGAVSDAISDGALARSGLTDLGALRCAVNRVGEVCWSPSQRTVKTMTITIWFAGWCARMGFHRLAIHLSSTWKQP